MTTLTTATTRPRFDLDQLLHGGLAELDITAAEHELAVRRYGELGEVLDEMWSFTRGNNKVFPQGSFRLGTVVRNVQRNDDIDIDVVAMRDIGKTSITQEELKDEVGSAVRRYARRVGSDHPAVEESSRCWTLSWPGMHMDILPAIPDAEVLRDGLLITDQDVRLWLPSNPVGYADWFGSRALRQLMASGRIEENRAEIEAVPQWERRSTLQRVVQALKRHRDVHFGGRLRERPSSIVLTTLAAHAYAGGADLLGVLRQVVSSMDEHLNFIDGVWALPNPAQPGENFVDSWAGEPDRADYFFDWLRAAGATFAGLETKSGLDQTIPALEAAFGNRFGRGASRTLAGHLGDARANRGLVLAQGGLSVVTGGTSDARPARTVREHGFAGGSSTI